MSDEHVVPNHPVLIQPQSIVHTDLKDEGRRKMYAIEDIEALQTDRFNAIDQNDMVQMRVMTKGQWTTVFIEPTSIKLIEPYLP